MYRTDNNTLSPPDGVHVTKSRQMEYTSSETEQAHIDFQHHR